MNSGSGIQELMAAETRASQIVAEARIGQCDLTYLEWGEAESSGDNAVVEDWRMTAAAATRHCIMAIDPDDPTTPISLNKSRNNVLLFVSLISSNALVCTSLFSI